VGVHHRPAAASSGYTRQSTSRPSTCAAAASEDTGCAYVAAVIPIGESHHLAMTAPPELWTRVIVVQWAELLVRATERSRSDHGDGL
jgi:hypothetical protein